MPVPRRKIPLMVHPLWNGFLIRLFFAKIAAWATAWATVHGGQIGMYGSLMLLVGGIVWSIPGRGQCRGRLPRQKFWVP
jgi:hypothetical protein